jgi:Uma2 family endonuclease
MASTLETPVLELGPEHNGVLLTPKEFDRADFEEGYRYELVNGVLIVSPAPLRQERDPNDELGYWLRSYKDHHPEGSVIDLTLSEEMIHIGKQRRRADRAIWAGLGRLPRRHEAPTIIAEFVSSGRRSFERDYREKRDEYRSVGVREYWIIDRFRRTMTVWVFPKKGRPVRKEFEADAVYTTPLLPGFELPLARMFELAERWDKRGRDE